MDVINVPAPPKEAFNKHRRISDLIKAQIKHLKHLEDKMPPSVRATLPQHAIVTENDAAVYIAAMTRLLREGVEAEEQPAKTKEVVLEFPPAAPAGLDIAASVEVQDSGTEGKPTAKKAAAKKAAKARKTASTKGPQ